MILKEKIRKLEQPILFGYVIFLIIVYFLGRNLVEMYTTHTPSWVFWWLSIFMAPFIIYGTLRLTIKDGGKWYGYFGYFLMLSVALLFSGSFIILKLDLIVSATIKPVNEQQLPILKVEKVISRKSFDHTAVTILFHQKPLTMEARPNTFFLLAHKKSIKMSIGESFLGNYFVTNLHMQTGARWQSRWSYLKDWAHRIWYVPVFFILLLTVILIGARYFPKKPLVQRKPMEFWRSMGIIMSIMMSLAIIFYLGLVIYVKCLAS